MLPKLTVTITTEHHKAASYHLFYTLYFHFYFTFTNECLFSQANHAFLKMQITQHWCIYFLLNLMMTM